MTVATRRVATVREVDREVRCLGAVVTVREADTASAAARKMARYDVGCVVVLGRDHGVTGILTERDIMTEVVAAGADPTSLPVSAIMTRDVISCRADTSIAKARRLMTGHGVRHLPIIEDGVPLGMLSSRDILAWQLSRARLVARRQRQALHRIEERHPDVSAWTHDPSGRVVIG
jgi:CBS domain-containing protein